MAKTEKSFPRNFTGCLTCVQVLNIMVLLGFMLNYALRVNLTIAIVEMIYDDNDNVTALNVTHPHNVTQHPEHLQQTRYHWDTKEKNLLLGCFFWGYVLTEIPGGRLAEVIGARRVFGYSTLLASILTLLTPAAAVAGFGWIVASRVLLGFLLGATWPAILPMASKWIPPMHRSKFMSNMMASSLGAAITMPICGFLIAHFGWESAFYFTGIIGVMWSMAWFAVVYDTPSQHPRISDTERNYLIKALPQDSNTKGHMSVPWRRMLVSTPVWAIIITHGASVFGYFTVVNQLPSYIESILHYSIKHNGLLSSLPYLGKYVCALASSVLADSLRRSGALTTTAARKLFTGLAVGLPGILMLAQAYFGHDRVWSIAIFTLALTINGAVTAGYLGNGLDIAPNFSGTIFGMANTLSSFGGWLSTFMVGELTHDNNTYEQWQYVFFILAGTYMVGALTFVTFGSGELQPWNSRAEIAQAQPNVALLSVEDPQNVSETMIITTQSDFRSSNMEQMKADQNIVVAHTQAKNRLAYDLDEELRFTSELFRNQFMEKEQAKVDTVDVQDSPNQSLSTCTDTENQDFKTTNSVPSANNNLNLQDGDLKVEQEQPLNDKYDDDEKA